MTTKITDENWLTETIKYLYEMKTRHISEFRDVNGKNAEAENVQALIDYLEETN